MSLFLINVYITAIANVATYLRILVWWKSFIFSGGQGREPGWHSEQHPATPIIGTIQAFPAFYIIIYLNIFFTLNIPLKLGWVQLLQPKLRDK